MSTFATLEAPDLADEIRVVGFRGTERLCRPYLFEIFAQVEGQGRAADLEEAISSTVTLKFQREQEQPQILRGILANVSLVHQMRAWALYRLELVPRVWRLGLTRHSRVFTKQSVPDIIKSVLEAAGLGAEDFELRPDGDYPEEELVVQYAESDLDFLHRWMEREGLYYFFEQTEAGEKLVIVDHVSFHKSLVERPVRYHPLAGYDTSAGECFDTFAAIRAATVGRVRLADYDYARPMLDVSADQKVSERGFDEIRVHAGRFFDPEQAKRFARIRAEELKARELVYHAAGTALHMSAGYLVSLSEHAIDRFNKDYLLTEVHHFCNQLQQEGDSHLGRIVKPEFEDVYRVEVKAADASQPYRTPEETPKPRVWGYESGVVDGPIDSEYAQLDEQGRYLVKLKLDESDLKDGKASTYLRMMQPHGGTTEGWHFPLRKGTEVIVTFLGGDPDRPIIAGVVPNAETPSPVTSDNQTWNIIQTGGSNRLRINDKKGEEYIDLSTPYNKTILAMGFPTSLKGFGEPPHDVEASIFLGTQGTAAFFFGGDWEIEVTGDKNELIGGNVAEEYRADHRSHVLANFDHIIDGSQTVKVTGARDDLVDGGVTELYSGHLDTTVSGPESHVVTGPQNLVVAGSQAVTTGARSDTINGSLTQTVSGPVTIDCPAMTVTAPGGIKQNTSSHFSFNTAAKLSITLGATADVFVGAKLSAASAVSLSLTGGYKFNGEFAAAFSLTGGVKADFGGASNLRSFPVTIDTTPVWVRNGAENILCGATFCQGPLYVYI
jgi:type VI secretion system secreted protein VgrG